MNDVIQLAPVKESIDDYDEIEKRIITAFRKIVFLPLMREMEAKGGDRFENARRSALEVAIGSGKVRLQAGQFSGRFGAEVTKELRSIGAVWDKATATFRIHLSLLEPEIRAAVAASEARFQERLKRIDAQLAKNLPLEISESIKTADLIDSSLWKTDRDLRKTLKQITVLPQVSAEARQKIADEWSGNLDLWIKDFTAEEIAKLRKQIERNAFSGNRYEEIVASIKRSYGVTQAKAKFLARQETSLLLTKFKETRYTEAGVHEYKWGCVAGSKNHPVRPSHKRLEGKVFRWDDPPITTEPGEPTRRNNPGQDFNCRCYAKPIVKFRKG